MTACGAVTQRIRRQPHGKIRAKPRIAEIQLRRFAEAFQFIVGIGGQQINDVQSHKNFQPLFCGTRSDVGRFGQRCIIDLLRNKGGTAHKKFAETDGVSNAASLGSITHQVGVDIGIEILLSEFVIHPLYLWHTALPNVMEYLNHIIFRKLALPCL